MSCNVTFARIYTYICVLFRDTRSVAIRYRTPARNPQLSNALVNPLCSGSERVEAVHHHAIMHDDDILVHMRRIVLSDDWAEQKAPTLSVVRFADSVAEPDGNSWLLDRNHVPPCLATRHFCDPSADRRGSRAYVHGPTRRRPTKGHKSREAARAFVRTWH